MLCYHPLLGTLGRRTLRWRKLVEPESQRLTEAAQVGPFGIGDANPMPTLARTYQRRVDQLQTAPFIEEARDDLGAPAFSLEAPLDKVRTPHALPMRDREPQVRQVRLEIVSQRGHRRRECSLKPSQDHLSALPRRSAHRGSPPGGPSPRLASHQGLCPRHFASDGLSSGSADSEARSSEWRAPSWRSIARDAHRRAQAAADHVPEHPEPAVVALLIAQCQVQHLLRVPNSRINSYIQKLDD
jgi:hypothetical protein